MQIASQQTILNVATARTGALTAMAPTDAGAVFLSAYMDGAPGSEIPCADGDPTDRMAAEAVGDSAAAEDAGVEPDPPCPDKVRTSAEIWPEMSGSNAAATRALAPELVRDGRRAIHLDGPEAAAEARFSDPREPKDTPGEQTLKAGIQAGDWKLRLTANGLFVVQPNEDDPQLNLSSQRPVAVMGERGYREHFRSGKSGMVESFTDPSASPSHAAAIFETSSLSPRGSRVAKGTASDAAGLAFAAISATAEGAIPLEARRIERVADSVAVPGGAPADTDASKRGSLAAPAPVAAVKSTAFPPTKDVPDGTGNVPAQKSAWNRSQTDNRTTVGFEGNGNTGGGAQDSHAVRPGSLGHENQLVRHFQKTGDVTRQPAKGMTAGPLQWLPASISVPRSETAANSAGSRVRGEASLPDSSPLGRPNRLDGETAGATAAIAGFGQDRQARVTGLPRGLTALAVPPSGGLTEERGAVSRMTGESLPAGKDGRQTGQTKLSQTGPLGTLVLFNEAKGGGQSLSDLQTADIGSREAGTIGLARGEQSPIQPQGRSDYLSSRAEAPRFPVPQVTETLIRHPNRAIELTLSPEELGRVRMALTSNDGSINVIISGDRTETLDLLRRHIDGLAQEFRRMGFENIGFEFRNPSAGGRPSDLPARRASMAEIESEPEPSSIPPRNPAAVSALDIRI